MDFNEAIQTFASWVHRTEKKRCENFFGLGKGLTYPGWEEEADVHVRPGKRWTKVDVKSSGRYIVDKDGQIYLIKGYGVPNLKKRVGSIHDEKWKEVGEK